MPTRESEDVAASPLEPTLPGEASPQAEPPAAGPSPESFPGEQWDHYELLELLGRGGMGEVYKARDRRLGRIVALKFLRGADPDHVMRFLQEARAQARIDHPHVCKVHEVGELHGKAYIAMQLLEGQRLDQAAPGLSPHEKVQLVKELAEAMHAAHKLGVIHRDLKPSNIMVERGEDGRWSPRVMDFGLAYDMGQGHGLTQTGALMGTPAYMAPEQARGDVRGIDRRADVYSLGATLYELLTGRVPFLAPSLAATLQLVLQEEPPHPRTLVPDVPDDLETIVLKCLSKEPGQRYSSARALAEDLGRYIDGEPILGQRPSLLSRLRRRARKHRTLVAVSGVSLVGMVLLASFGARSWLEARSTRRQSAERSRLAGQLGQQVKEVEWFLRSAALLPLHDTTPEQRLVRQRMTQMAARQHDQGGYGEGLVHYALGRGHLALDELEQARQELTRAQQQGIDSPELHYALGRVLGELYQRTQGELYRRSQAYRQALKETGSSGGEDWVAEQQRRLEKQYLEPALQSLERSRGLEWESSRYLEGLIAFYRKHYDLASRLAAQAVEETPWLYEARRLEGDVAYAQAMEQLERGEYAPASTGFEAATGLYARAAEAWRSDARTYEALSRAWWQRSELEFREGRSRRASLESALAASHQGLQADPQRAASYTLRAQLLMNWYRLMRFQNGGSQPGPILDEWTDTARRAVTLDPRDVYAYDTLGYSQYMRGSQQVLDGVDPNGSWNEAIGWFDRALELQPDSAWSHNDLATIYRWKGSYQQAHGEDPRESFAQAERHLLLAARSDPKYLFAYTNLVDLYNVMAASEFASGRSPQGMLERARHAGQQALALDEHFFQALTQLALAELTSARFHLDSGADPRQDLERARPLLERSVAINSSAPQTWLAWAHLHLVEVEAALGEGRAPGPALDAGHRALAETVRLSPKMIERRLVSVRMDLAEAEWARREGRPVRPLLRRALDEARRAVEQFSHVDTHLELARVLGRWAEVSSSQEASAAITEGLEQVSRALVLDPTRARAQALRGRLLLTRARAMRETPARLDTVREAQAALARALELNPLLEREYAPSLHEARSLLPPADRNGSP